MNAFRQAACAILLSWGAAAQASCKLQAMELPVHMDGTRAIATLGINGTPVPVIVDSGAFYSTLTRASAEQLGLTLRSLPDGFTVTGFAGNMVRPKKAVVKTVQLQGAQIDDIEFLVGGNDSGLGAMGILGRNILGIFDTEYDLAHGMIRLVRRGSDCDKANMAYWAQDTPVSQVALLPDRYAIRPAIRARLEVNGHEITALFDTGASTVVSLDVAHDAGLKDADLHRDGTSYGIGSGSVRSWSGRFESVSLGGETVHNNRLQVSEFDTHDFDMLVGIDFFLAHRIYVSTDTSQMFFTYNGGPVFSRNVADPAAVAPEPASQAAGALTAEALYRRGTASLARRDVASALADLEQACALEPGNARFHLAQAQALAALKRPADAMAELDATLALDPRLDDARLMRTALRADDANPAPALQDLAVLDDALPAQSNMRRALALAYEHLGVSAQAIKQWTLWIANHRDDIRLPAARNSRCRDRVKANIDLDQAIADCDDAIFDESRNAAFLDTRGWLRLRLGQPGKAKADFDRAIKIDAASAYSLYGRALARTTLGETAPAQADLAAARLADPQVDAKVKADGLQVAP